MYVTEGWKEVLINVIDADVLPKFLGGNRTDPDGSPLCNTFLVHAGMIPEKYYLTKDFSKIAGKEGATYITVEKQSKLQVPIYIQYADSILNWEYEVKINDIGFGLIAETKSSDLLEKELIPIHKVLTELKSETGMYRCKEAGTCKHFFIFLTYNFVLHIFMYKSSNISFNYFINKLKYNIVLHFFKRNRLEQSSGMSKCGNVQ
ncbi:UNVERIFIED_CONTAM: Retinal-binding protein [Trichonephila clavipes]